MAEPVTSVIKEETPRAQPQQPSDDREIQEVRTSQAQPQRIDPKLLRAIVNGDLISFKKILGIEEPTKDIESIRTTNGNNSSLRAVTCGGNTALHVVAGVVEKSSKNIEPIISIDLPVYIVYATFGMFLNYRMYRRLIRHLVPTISFLSPPKRIRDHTAMDVLLFPEGTHVKKNSPVVKRKWHTQRKQQKEEIEKEKKNLLDALPSRLQKCVSYFPPYRILYERRMYLQIAEIIYGQDEDRTFLNARNYAKETPLHCAAKAGNLHMVSLLVNFASEEAHKEGPQKLAEVLRARNKVGETALHEAARSGYSGIVEELLSADKYLISLALLGADENLANVVDNNGISPLYWAAAAGCLDVVDMLIAANSPTSYAGPDEQTALHAAAMRQEEENIMRAILDWNPSLAAITDRAGNTPLHYAALIGNSYAVKVLLSKDTESVHKANLAGSFPVHLAADAGNFTVIEELLSMCPDVGELLDKEERNFLHVAVQKKMIRVITLACQEGINANVMNAKDKDGNTPLHLAVINSESEIFALLSLNRRVNLNIRNKVGLTPLDISSSLADCQFTNSLNPQSIIYRALLTRGAFQNRCQPDLPKIDNNLVKKGDVASVDYPNRKEGKEMWSGVEVDIEKESSKYENMSKSLITGAVLIASATFAAIFTVLDVYRGDRTSHTLISRRTVFNVFVMADVLAFIFAMVSTIWLLYTALSKFHLKYRKFYFQRCTSLLYGAIIFFMLTFGLGAYIAIAPLCEWLALLILVVTGSAILWNIIFSPNFIPIILLAPYITTELDYKIKG